MLARLHTFRKAHAALNGGSLFSCQYEVPDELLTHSHIVHEHIGSGSLLNYARPLLYMMFLSNANIIDASYSFRLLENSTTERYVFLSLQYLTHSISTSP